MPPTVAKQDLKLSARGSGPRRLRHPNRQKSSTRAMAHGPWRHFDTQLAAPHRQRPRVQVVLARTIDTGGLSALSACQLERT